MSESTRSNSGTADFGTRTQNQVNSSTSGQPSSRRDSESTRGSGDLKAQSQEVVGQAQEQAQNLVNTAREQATSQLTTQKERAADSLTTIVTVLQAASQEMRKQDGGPIADYIDTAAGQVDQIATALRDKDISQLLKTTEQFARRQPALFLAAAFALGFAGTRFLKSSSGASGRMSEGNGYRQSQGRSDWQSSGSYGSRSSSSTIGGRYGSGLESGNESRFTGSAGSKSNSEWQASSGYNAGPEGQ
jgi:hypothetical protein